MYWKITSLASLALGILLQTVRQRRASAELVVSQDPREPADEAKAFHLPPGFEAQLVASEPDIHKPINIAFDDKGRLWVTDTVEYPFPVAEGKPTRDTLKILSDFAPDGRCPVDQHVRRSPQYSDRRVAAAHRRRARQRDRLFHPRRLAADRHQGHGKSR